MDDLKKEETMNQDKLTDANVLISAIHPLRNIMMCEGGDAIELVDNLIDGAPKLVEGLAEFIESGWEQYELTDSNGEPLEAFGDAEEWQKRELLSEWAYRHVPDSLLIAAVSAPVPKYRSEGSCYSFSWGYTFTGFVAGSSIEELYRAAAAWKEERYEGEKKEAA